MINKAYSTINILGKALDGTWLRNEAISNNMANVNTPGYKRVTVEFENMLKSEISNNQTILKRTNEKHFDITGKSKFSPVIKGNNSTSARRDGNNVNIDTEMADLAKNTIMYDALVRQVSDEFKKIKNVIEQGGK